MPTNPSSRTAGRFPNGARFAFTIIDDTDVSTLVNIRPFYELLHQLGMRTTKTVWPVGCPEGSPDFHTSTTLEDSEYLEYVRSLQARGFEITWHGATMESSERPRTIAALESMQRLLGVTPRVHAQHAYNRENLYWGEDRLDAPMLRALLARLSIFPPGHYAGHREGSPYWWGDLAKGRIEYARNLTYPRINTLAANPSMPYRDPRRPLVPWWFSASTAEDADAFVALTSDANLDRLEREGGACIVATHVGKGFAPFGVLDPRVESRVRAVASRNGWFVPVGTLLDHLRSQRPGDGTIPQAEWKRMQWRWVFDTIVARVRARATGKLR